jgi:hypothetical protein
MVKKDGFPSHLSVLVVLKEEETGFPVVSREFSFSWGLGVKVLFRRHKSMNGGANSRL